MKTGTRTINFTVDAALFRELGERLVGKQHIALAELVKNSYDADATLVEINFAKDRITISDDGNGMSLEQFRDFWMRVGSPHKQLERRSPIYKRPFTGSKGVGRLAVQFLANRVTLRTTSRENLTREVSAEVDWEQAIRAGDLTNAQARYVKQVRKKVFAKGSSHGTEIVLTRVRHEWGPGELRQLAREVWYLQPPFKPNPRLKTDAQRRFDVRVLSVDATTVSEFDAQMQAALQSWEARLVGRLKRVGRGPNAKGRVDLIVEQSGGDRDEYRYDVKDCVLFETEFEIRVYRHSQRQPHGVKVQTARGYFKEFGGVQVYDGGFHLPYYGVDNDWLDIERDHSHRLSSSRLLPDELQLSRGLLYLPTQTRLFGVVHVDTAREAQLAAGDGPAVEQQHLRIQVSRDRLVDNPAFANLREVVRHALDFYAVRAAARAAMLAADLQPIERVSTSVSQLNEILEQNEAAIPAPVAVAIRDTLRDVVAGTKAETDNLASHAGLLGALATAGVNALAIEHELSKRMATLSSIADELAEVELKGSAARSQVQRLAKEIRDWVSQAEATRGVFSPLMQKEDRERKERLRARPVVEAISHQVRVLLRGVAVDDDAVDPDLRLPPATLAEWSAIFQNVFTNAVNAMLDSRKKQLRVRSEQRARFRAIIVEDSGIGIELERADSLFEPFARELETSEARRQLGYGGTGLGLTIVRMIATSLGCKVAFVEPAKGYRTAFRLSWMETK